MLNKRNLYIIILLVFCNIFVISTVVAADNIAVAVSQSRVMSFYGVERVAIANPDIADVLVVSTTEVLLVGKTPGTTTLHIWSNGKRESFQVEVVANDVPIANEIKSIIGLEDLKVSKIGKTIILEGKVNSQYQKARAEKVAEAYGEKVVNLLEMTKPLQVKIEAVIIEIDREKTKELGMKWGNDTSAPGVFSFGQSAVNSFLNGSVLGGLNTYNPINGQLSALIKNGSAKILSQPSIITLSGGTASIMVGGQIPIPTSNQNGQIAIEWKDYGIKLDIAPEVNAEGLINSKIKAEVSSLDWNSTHKIEIGSNMNIPPIKLNKAETFIALSSGQTMAIGGLLSSQTSKDITKVPFLSDIPILGKLFTSTSYSRGETELVILVTPTIVDPAEYLPHVTTEMQEFIKEDPLGGNQDGGKNKNSHR